MGKRELLSRALYASGLLRAAGRLAPDSITVLTYHRIRPDHARAEPPFDEDVFGPTQACFAEQMTWLKRHLTVLSEAELLEMIGRKNPAKGHFAVVTFDDGYRDNYELAWPVLRDLAIPAIFFVSPALIDERRVGWWDVIAYLVKHSAKTRIEIRGEVASIRVVRTLAYPAGSHGHFTDATMRIAEECGYEGAFSFHSGGNRLGSIDPFDIHRISAAEEFNPMFAGAAILPEVFSWVR